MKKNNKKGFTLVELVIVVAVMAILVAIAIPTVKSVVGKAQTAVNDSNAQTVESMIKLYLANNQVEASTTTITTALKDATLDIKSGTFIYDTTTGSVTYGTNAGTNQFKITFNASATNEADKIKVEQGSGSSSSPESSADS